ncbi:hypothetical protein OAS39_10840, partial [Pirellulales bacterium]|nr:hypothetical protein [Pirellulales bacterium]
MLILSAQTPFAAAIDVEDAFGRPDSTDLGVTDVGGFGYLEASTTSSGGDTADILGEELRLFGGEGVGSSGPGVALVDVDLVDLDISADVRFTYPNGILNTSSYNNGGFVLRRNGTTAGFGAGNESQIEISMQVGGGLFVREITGGSLNNLFFDNPFGLGGSTDNNYSAAGQLPTMVNGLPFDANGNGILEDNEPFRLGASLSGSSLSVTVNGSEIANLATSASAPSQTRSTAGFYKNRWTSGGTRDVMTPIFDNLLADGIGPPPPPPIRHVGD